LYSFLLHGFRDVVVQLIAQSPSPFSRRYRFVTKNTVEERILERAQQKSDIQAMVMTGSADATDMMTELKSKDMASLLVDRDIEVEIKRRKDHDRSRQSSQPLPTSEPPIAAGNVSKRQRTESDTDERRNVDDTPNTDDGKRLRAELGV
jgi:hypothetical protein